MPSSATTPATMLLYRGQLYRLARTQEDLAWENIAKLAKQVNDVSKSKISGIDKRDRVGYLLTEMTKHLKVVGLQSPLI